MSESGGRIDLLVLGGGMAGLSAAAYACAHGASVVLVEKAPAVGGSAAYAGYIHTAPDARRHARGQPRRRPEARGPAGRRASPPGSTGCARSASHVAEPVSVLGYSRGCQTDMANYLLACERLVREHGEVLTNATARASAARGRRRHRRGHPDGRRRAHDPRALDAAGHRRLRRRPRAARAAHPPARARPPAAGERLQHRRRPAAGAARRRRLRPARRRLLRPPDPVAAWPTRTPTSSST